MSSITCSRLGVCTLTNYCHNRTAVFPAYATDIAIQPLQLSSFPGTFTLRGVYDAMTDPVWFSPAAAPPDGFEASAWHSTLWLYAPAAWPNLRVAHMMLGGWAPLFFSLANETESVDLLAFQSGTLAYRVGAGYVVQEGGCIPRDLHALYRQFLPVLRHIRCAGDVLGAGRTVTSMAVVGEADGSHTRDIRCYRTMRAGLPVTGDAIMRSASHPSWRGFRAAFLRGTQCAPTDQSSSSLPSVFVIARKALGIQAFGNRMFTGKAVRAFHAMLARLQSRRVIGSYGVGDTGDGGLSAQGCAFSQWSIVIGVHGNGLGWTPLLPRTSWTVILCRVTEPSYCGFYSLVARSTGCNSASYPVANLNTPALARLERELRMVIVPKWRARVEGESYIIK